MSNDALVLAGMSGASETASRSEQADLMGEAAFQALNRRTARPLWAYVYRVTGHASDADDILQEAFCRVLRSPLAGWFSEADSTALSAWASSMTPSAIVPLVVGAVILLAGTLLFTVRSLMTE